MLFEELTAIAEKTKSGRKQVCVRCCMSAGCMSSQADEIKKSLELAVAEKNLADKVEIRRVGCMGFCGKGPMVSVEEKDDTIRGIIPSRLGCSGRSPAERPRPSLAIQNTPSSRTRCLWFVPMADGSIRSRLMVTLKWGDTQPSTMLFRISHPRRWSRSSCKAVSGAGEEPGIRAD